MSPPASRPPVRELFAQRFGRPCAVVARAPGRVNLIGEHTDYNDGFVLPIALGQSTWVAAGPRSDGRIRAWSQSCEIEQTWPLDDWAADRPAPWTGYIAGVATLLRRRGVPLAGCDLAVVSDVPVGGGLSSSAALEVATALALSCVAGATVAPLELADLCRAAEHEFAGVPCGIMDQYASVLARADCALLIDCRARAWEHIPLKLGEHVILVVNSGVRHDLAAGAYAQRQRECRQAADLLRSLQPGVAGLRDVDEATVERRAGRLGTVCAARARHVTSENARTIAAAEALRRNDLETFGRLLSASHASLRDDFEVSCVELDRLVDIVGRVPGVLGARLTGAGFGGCIVALVPRGSVPAVEEAVRRKYDAEGYGPARVLVAHPGAGASIVEGRRVGNSGQ